MSTEGLVTLSSGGWLFSTLEGISFFQKGSPLDLRQSGLEIKKGPFDDGPRRVFFGGGGSYWACCRASEVETKKPAGKHRAGLFGEFGRDSAHKWAAIFYVGAVCPTLSLHSV